VKDGKFIAVGSNDDILSKFESKETIDANGKAVFPGFIDSHCHFYGYGQSLQQVNLVGTRSFDEVIERIKEHSAKNPSTNGWIVGRGWDQNDWPEKEYPKRYLLDQLFPTTPVFIERIDGHAALVNGEALRRAAINSSTKVDGGVIEIDKITKEQGEKYNWTPDGNKELKNAEYPVSLPSGILIDNAVDLIKKVIPKPTTQDIRKALLAAQQNCVQVGLTTVDDAGLEKKIIDEIDAAQKSNELKMRVYAMLTDNKENIHHYIKNGAYKTERLNVRSFKYYIDGALGSRGACLLSPYSDKPETSGLLLNKISHIDSSAVLCLDKGFQMNSHCIGDSAVRLMVNINGNFSLENKDNHRWRIEHSQVVDKADLEYFKGFIPSVQPTHATSDMYWAHERLGNERVKNAYAYNDLLKASGIIALGTDFPVENINPMFTFYSAVARKDLKGFPKEGYQMENALSRENTLRGMTIWGAYANFEEKEKGSIETGKFADFVILENDIMKCKIDSVPKTNVVGTFIGGEKVYFRK
jgi:predicted amidohydrolase YtcJ